MPIEDESYFGIIGKRERDDLKRRDRVRSLIMQQGHGSSTGLTNQQIAAINHNIDLSTEQGQNVFRKSKTPNRRNRKGSHKGNKGRR